MVFYPNITNVSSFTAWEAELKVQHAHQNAVLVKHEAHTHLQVSIEHVDIDFAVSDFDLKDLETELKEAQVSCRQHNIEGMANKRALTDSKDANGRADQRAQESSI